MIGCSKCGFLLESEDPADIKRIAELEYKIEKFNEAVKQKKEELRVKKSLIQKLFPYKLKLERR